MDIETLTKVADVLADVTGHAGDTAPEEGSEAQVAISKILTGLADKLGDEDGPSTKSAGVPRGAAPANPR